ncbi:S8 family peptidase [Cryobacterium sp. W22_MBD10_FK3]|uniref:S8 family peptidase n=1 Tax=Cryobacterium sp. W22_MBD10_FK3 TaxID=3240273 RepID=UPI003F931D6E
MSDVGSPGRSRPLLGRGEALRIAVTTPPSGGGDKFVPQTAEEARVLLSPQLSLARDKALALPTNLRGNRLYIEARLLPNYIAASSFPTSLLSQVGAVPVGSRADKTWYETKTKKKQAGTRRLILSIEEAGLEALSALMATGGSSKSERQAFDEIKKFDAISISTPPQNLIETDAALWEAVLHPEIQTSGEMVRSSADLLEKWFALVESLGGAVRRDYVRVVGGLTFTAVELPPHQAGAAVQFNPLRVMRPMPGIRPRPNLRTRSMQKLLPVTFVPHLPELPRVAVFDGGIPGTSPLFPAGSIDLTTEAPGTEELKHGTGVTGAAMYGLAQPGTTAAHPPLHVDSYRVFPAPAGDPDGYWILDRIAETVRLGAHRIVNLSLGPALAVEDDQEPNLWTSTLDQLAWEHDVLFVVAAGNDGDQDRSLGLNRVQVPADMANGLSVGSCDTSNLTERWVRAPYSSMGPGRQGSRVQPIGLQFGGVSGKEFPLLRADGTFDSAIGTSFSAPLATYALSDLAAGITDASPSVLRAFAVHFTERHRFHKKFRNEVGYGRLPISFRPYLECGPDKVHVLYSDEVARHELLGYQVPLPTAHSDNLEVRVTLAYASPVDPTEPSEYTQASVEISFRPHEHLYSFRPPKGSGEKSRTLDQRTPEALGLISAGWKSGQEPVTRGLGTSGPIPESHLRDDGKWETVRHARISLPKGSTFNPRLEVSYLARNSGMLDNSPKALPFALLVSIVDKDEKGNLYDEVRAQYTALRPMIRVQPQVRVPASPL